MIVYWMCQAIVSALEAEGLGSGHEAFPKQPPLTAARPYGNWARLFGKHHKTGIWSRVWDPARGEWLAGEECVRHILAIAGNNRDDDRRPSGIPDLESPRREADRGIRI